MKIPSLLVVGAFSLLPFLAATTVQAQQHTPAVAEAAGTPAIQTGGEVAATTAAEVWLALLDDGQYAKSWQSAAGEMRKLITEDQWVKLTSAKRTPLGKVTSRKLKSTKFHRNPPGAPEGQYVVIIYETTFEHKAGASEMVTPMLDKDGQWRVSGYYVK